MDWHLTFATARLLAAVTNLALGLIVFMARPERLQNRLISAMLLLNFFIHTLIALIPVLPSQNAYALFAPAFLSMILYVSTYLVFTGTLDTPLGRPFRGRIGITSVGIGATVFALTLFWARSSWYHPAFPWPLDPVATGWDSVLQTQALKSMLESVIVLHFLYGFAAAFHAYLRAKDPIQRRKMKWFAIAFGSHDILLAVSFGLTIGLATTGTACATCDLFAFFILISLAGVLLAAFLAYGILTTQLFDIELRIKRGISRSALLAIFLAVFVGVAAAAEEYLNDAYGILAGGLAAAALVLALAPLQRFADRVSDAAMPGVRDTPEYLESRRREIYQAALHSARHDGSITQRERRVLATLADELGLSATEAVDLEDGPNV